MSLRLTLPNPFDLLNLRPFEEEEEGLRYTNGSEHRDDDPCSQVNGESFHNTRTESEENSTSNQ